MLLRFIYSVFACCGRMDSVKNVNVINKMIEVSDVNKNVNK